MAVLEVSYPAATAPAPGLDAHIRVDYGVGGGAMPQDEVAVGSLLGDVVATQGLDVRQFGDLQPFRITVLHPARTLLEKLCLVHHNAVRLLHDQSYQMRSPQARHYYDLFHLLDPARSPALGWLADQGDWQPVLDDCLRITQRFYGQDDPPPRPLPSSPAFTDDRVLDVVHQRYPR